MSQEIINNIAIPIAAVATLGMILIILQSMIIRLDKKLSKIEILLTAIIGNDTINKSDIGND